MRLVQVSSLWGFAILLLSGCPDARTNPGNGANGGGGQGAGQTGGQGGDGAQGGDGGQGGSQCDMASDCPLPQACYLAECTDHVCGETTATLNAGCGQGNVCDGAGNCVECNDNNQCTDQICDSRLHQCVPPPATCTDERMNGNETALDCGGDCPPCQNGDTCELATDCVSNLCAGDPLVCTPCNNADDCEDGVEYCFANVCTPKLTLGETCGADVSCASDHCVDAVCCNSPCDGGDCRGCATALTGQPDGMCAAVMVDTDPHNDCTADIGCGTGTCNGIGACDVVASGIPCGSTNCAGSILTEQKCNGNGSCVSQNPAPCANGHICASGGTCDNNCGGQDAQCQANYFCATNNTCMAKRSNGQGCGTGNQCLSGSCTDGVCCNVPCGGVCRSCLAADTGLANGTCGDMLANTDPDNECSFSCAGAGATCCNNTCNLQCRDCRAANTGQPNGTCAIVTFGTDPNDDCAGSMTCNSNGGCMP